MIAICGPGESGKDEASRWLAENTILLYKKSTSQAAAEVVFERWGKDHYYTVQECWNDRRNHRQTWQDTILAYNAEDPEHIRLYREMQHTHDIFNGIRTKADLEACRRHGLIHLAIWIRRDAVPNTDPMIVTEQDCDITIVNNGSLDEFHRKLAALAQYLEPST